MTAQMADRVELEGRSFSLAGVSGGPLFEPATVGLRPTMMNTACWRGYVSTYRVVDGRLRLSELLVGAGSTVDGRVVGPRTALLGQVPTRRKSLGAFLYAGLAHDVPFSGGLLLGDGFVPSLYRHMGFHPAWKYETVIELLVTDGRVHAAHDRSVDVARVRAEIQAGVTEEPDGRHGGAAWVERTFSLDYRRTFGEM